MPPLARSRHRGIQPLSLGTGSRRTAPGDPGLSSDPWHQLSIGSDIRASDEFDIIVDYKRAATGEVEMGDLLYAGLERSGKPRAQMLRWKTGNGAQWFEASGVGEERGEFARPVNGAMTSRFGMRRHPILGFRRMHSGVDFRARSGTPIYATADGVVNYSGRKGGYGNFVRIAHGGNLASGYGHMSRIAVSNGTRVRRGQVIGYVGSTGLSTGPHLHYELYRGGRAIDPTSVRFTSRAQLSGSELANFRARLKQLLGVPRALRCSRSRRRPMPSRPSPSARLNGSRVPLSPDRGDRRAGPCSLQRELRINPRRRARYPHPRPAAFPRAAHSHDRGDTPG